MIVRKSEINGIKFFYREGFSDLKTFDEVLGNKVYLKKGMTINAGERWMDCGGNVGAFMLQEFFGNFPTAIDIADEISGWRTGIIQESFAKGRVS